MKLNILTLGDSIAAGVIAGGEYNSYEGASENLAKLLSAKNEIGFYQNWALSGETTDEFFDLVSMDYSSEEFLRRLENNYRHYHGGEIDKEYELRIAKIKRNTNMFELIKKSHIIYVNIGGNDLLQNHILKMNMDLIEHTHLNIVRNYRKFINLVQLINPDVEIYLNQMFWPDMNLPTLTNFQICAWHLNVAIKEISTYYDNVYLVEPSLDINHYNEKYLEWGDVHPNKDGYEKLTESFVKAIKKHTKLTIQW